MKKFILASIAAAGFSTVAIAQEAPIFHGDVSSSVENSLPNNEVNNGNATAPKFKLDFMPTASVDKKRSDGKITLKDTMNDRLDPNLEGR